MTQLSHQFSQEFTASRLALARRRCGWTKRELAEAVDLSERTITAYESGEWEPNEAHLAAIAQALGFPIKFFHRSDPNSIPVGSVSFRSLSRMTASQRDRAIAGGELALELSSWVETRFQLPNPDIPDLRPVQDPEAAAMALRGRWGLGDHPISNMVRLLESKGVRVFSLAEQGQEVDAFSFWRNDKPFIFLNTVKTAERSRFDAAHELGHLVLHRHGAPNGRPAEKEADAFASAFLMPRSSILAYAPRVPTLSKLIQAKRHWKVAVSALAYRMHKIGMISDWHYRNLVIEIQQKGLTKGEPESIPREMSLVYEKVFGGLRSEGMGKAEVARELNWPLTELNALVFGLVLSSIRGGGTDQPKTTEKRDAQDADRPQLTILK